MRDKFQLEVSRRPLRKVEVSLLNKYEAWFHCWVGTSELPKALLELENGEMVCVEYSHIKFIK